MKIKMQKKDSLKHRWVSFWLLVLPRQQLLVLEFLVVFLLVILLVWNNLLHQGFKSRFYFEQRKTKLKKSISNEFHFDWVNKIRPIKSLKKRNFLEVHKMMKWSDKEMVLEAVKQNGYSLKYASKELKNDKEVVLEAVKQYSYSLQYASKELKNDKEVVLEAVKKNGYSLEYASKELQNNKEVVLEAVKKNCDSLQYASEELKNDKEVVLEAVKKNGNSLKYASKELKNDKEVVWISNGYFKLIKSIKTFDLNFKFSKKRKLDEIE
jgi:hypothetical protein